MKIRKTLRYIADCGRGFWKKEPCLNHEEACKCWANPKFKTCKTCRHEILTPAYHDYITGQFDPIERDCAVDYDYDNWTPPVNDEGEVLADDLNMNCPLWVNASPSP